MYDIDAYYDMVAAAFPEAAALVARIRQAEGDDLYPFLWNLLAPLLLNVGRHGAKARRRQVFALTDELMARHPEITNEIGVGVVEMASDGWYPAAAEYAGPLLRQRLDGWEPGWQTRTGQPRRYADPYLVEKALRLTGSAPPAAPAAEHR